MANNLSINLKNKMNTTLEKMEVPCDECDKVFPEDMHVNPDGSMDIAMPEGATMSPDGSEMIFPAPID